MSYTPKFDKRAYYRNWMRRRRAAFFFDKLCENCGAMDDLELVYINSADKHCRNPWSWNSVRLAAEVKKCRILCTKCRKEVVRVRRLAMCGPIKHGTQHAYLKYYCRCEVCRKYYSEYRRRKYARTGR